MSHWVNIEPEPNDPWDPDEFQAEAMEAARVWLQWFNRQPGLPTPEEALPLLEDVVRPICERLVPSHTKFEVKILITLITGEEWVVLMDNEGSCRIA